MGVFPNWKIFPWNFYRSFFFLIFHCIQLKYHLNQIFYDIPIIREIIHYPVKAKKKIFLKKIFKICQKCVVMCILDILFRQITTFIKVCVGFVFLLQTLQLRDFSKINQLNSLKAENKGHTNFYECCDLTKKVYLGP